METGVLLALVQEYTFVLSVLGAFIFTAFVFGRQTMANVILGVYPALLLFILFPYTDQLTDLVSDQFTPIILIGFFVGLAALGTLLVSHLMPREYDEGLFEAFLSKVALVASASALVLVLSHHFLPVSVLVSLDSPLQNLFTNDVAAFFFVLLPLVVIFFAV